MKYPLHQVEVMLPMGAQAILVPGLASVKEHYEQGRFTAFPYWATIWPAAVALCIFLQEAPARIRDKKILELAAGLGLPSLVAARFARSVICTDMDEDAMTIAAESAVLCGISNLQCLALDWNAIPAGVTADVLLLSDVNYEPAAFETLFEVMQGFIQRGAEIILATPQRLMAKPFIERLLPWCIHQQMITAQAPGGQNADISILCLARS